MMWPHELFSARCGQAEGSALIVTELDFVDLRGWNLHYRADLPANQPMKRKVYRQPL
jgi:hypothetical protein